MAQNKFSGRERQVHHRNYGGQGPGSEGYVNVPPGEQGQYGMRRGGPTEPWYNQAGAGTHSADERDSHYAQWREQQVARLDADYQDWKKEKYASFCKDFETWRRAQTAPGTNVRSPERDKAEDK